MRAGRTDHLLPEKIKPLQRSHGLRARLHVSKRDVRLASHLVVPKSDDVEDRAVGREEGVEGEAEVGFLDLFGEIGQVESVMV